MKIGVAVLLMVVLAGCGGGTPTTGGKGGKTIAYVGYSSSAPFWIVVKNGAEAAAKERGATLLDLSFAKPDIQKQHEGIENAVLQRVDGLIVGAVDSRGLAAPLKKAHEAKIPVVTVDTRVPDDKVLCHIATDNVNAAKLAGEYIAKRLNNKGKVLLLGGQPGSQTADDRQKGVEDVLKAKGMEVIFRPADWDEAKANEIAQNELGANADLGAIFAACDPMIITAKQAVKAQGKLGKIVLVGFDAIEACLTAIKNGEVDATIRQDPYRMGYEGVMRMLDHLEGKEIPKDVPIQAEVIDKSNVDKFLGK
ncbi:MAG TPA: sugar ABC transporter substrate-binding protein [Planctomycetota bacterium]|jgi:ribose transport system substrate-binding protein